MMSFGPVGLLAGAGPLPLIAARNARRTGRPVIAVQLAETGQDNLNSLCEQTITVSLGQVEKIIGFWQEHGVRDVVLLGKVEKQLNFENLDFDKTALMMLARLADRADHSIFQVIAGELDNRKLRVRPQTELLSDLLTPVGLLAGPEPDEQVRRDYEKGMALAMRLAGYEVGQTVVIRQGAVVAVEAFEHTDATLRRAGKLAGKGWVAVKTARPKQDPRFDVPTIGLQTLANLRRSGGVCLAVEAENTFMIHQKRMQAYANRYDISLVGVKRVS